MTDGKVSMQSNEASPIVSQVCKLKIHFDYMDTSDSHFSSLFTSVSTPFGQLCDTVKRSAASIPRFKEKLQSTHQLFSVYSPPHMSCASAFISVTHRLAPQLTERLWLYPCGL